MANKSIFTRGEKEIINKAWAFFTEAADQVGMIREVHEAVKFERKERHGDVCAARSQIMNGIEHRDDSLYSISYLSPGVRIGAMVGARCEGSTNVNFAELRGVVLEARKACVAAFERYILEHRSE